MCKSPRRQKYSGFRMVTMYLTKVITQLAVTLSPVHVPCCARSSCLGASLVQEKSHVFLLGQLFLFSVDLFIILPVAALKHSCFEKCMVEYIALHFYWIPKAPESIFTERIELKSQFLSVMIAVSINGITGKASESRILPYQKLP